MRFDILKFPFFNSGLQYLVHSLGKKIGMIRKNIPEEIIWGLFPRSLAIVIRNVIRKRMGVVGGGRVILGELWRLGMGFPVKWLNA